MKAPENLCTNYKCYKSWKSLNCCRVHIYNQKRFEIRSTSKKEHYNNIKNMQQQHTTTTYNNNTTTIYNNNNNNLQQ